MAANNMAPIKNNFTNNMEKSGPIERDVPLYTRTIDKTNKETANMRSAIDRLTRQHNDTTQAAAKIR